MTVLASPPAELLNVLCRLAQMCAWTYVLVETKSCFTTSQQQVDLCVCESSFESHHSTNACKQPRVRQNTSTWPACTVKPVLKDKQHVVKLAPSRDPNHCHTVHLMSRLFPDFLQSHKQHIRTACLAVKRDSTVLSTIRQHYHALSSHSYYV